MEDINQTCHKVIELTLKGSIEEAFNIIAPIINKNPEHELANYATGLCLFADKKYELAINYFGRCIAANPKNIEAFLHLAVSHSAAATHSGNAKCRDLLLHTITNLSEQPEFSRHATIILQLAAKTCRMVGPRKDELFLRRLLVQREGTAEEYFHLSEICADMDLLDEAENALRKAIELEPATYDTPINQQGLHLLEQSRLAKHKPVIKKGRYPETAIFHEDLGTLIRDHIAVEHKTSPKFIGKDTAFFTMGSCFARNISRALIHRGYKATHMDIAEHINTTFANRYFVDWLEDALPNDSLRERIEELLPENFSKELILERIRSCDVFILTLGVAPVFFDRQSGDFIMPRPSRLNARALAEKYVYRTTSVEDNAANVMYLLSFIRKLAPQCKIIVTVSPVPLHMTFEFDSAITADCLSKSVMRLTAHDVVHNRGLKDVYYWPSFEVFRWAGSHAGPYYATDDGAAWHVSEQAVNTVIDSFIELFSPPAAE